MRFEDCLCLGCIEDLPRTRFHDDPLNKVEQLFRGKLKLQAASSFLHFARKGMVQRMLHRLKYAHDENVGLTLGRLMAEDILTSERFRTVDLFIPVPLHPRKQRKRGYNQSEVLVRGMGQVWPIPSLDKELLRVIRTPSQTRRGRLDRWLNVKEAFQLPDPDILRNKHVLLVDDVVTTGATAEACIKALADVEGIRISFYTAACA